MFSSILSTGSKFLSPRISLFLHICTSQLEKSFTISSLEAPHCSLNSSPCLCLQIAMAIQSKYDFPFNTSDGNIIFSSKDAALTQFFMDLSKSLVAPVIISFSFALVKATYNILISSDNVSSLILFFIASLAKVLYEFLFFKLTKSGPKPSSSWNNIELLKSIKLNCFPIPQVNTIGNSRPLLLCILMILTTSSFSPRIFALPISPEDFRSLLINVIKLNNPLKLVLSYCFARWNKIFKLACLKVPLGIAPTYP